MLLMRIMYDLRRIQLRFIAKVLHRGPDECWLWLGRKNSTSRPRRNGHIREPYGTFAIRSRSVYAHRWALFGIAALTTKDKALHTCDNPLCCNPRHLYAGTGADNIRDAFARNRIARGAGKRFAKPVPHIGDVIHSDFDVTTVDTSSTLSFDSMHVHRAHISTPAPNDSVFEESIVEWAGGLHVAANVNHGDESNG